MMKRRSAHAGLRGEIIDTQRLREVPLQPVDRPRYSMTLTPRRRKNMENFPFSLYNPSKICWNVKYLPAVNSRGDRHLLPTIHNILILDA
jgi:hypothetical protein